MTRKQIITLCITLVALTGGLLLLTSYALENTKQDGSIGSNASPVSAGKSIPAMAAELMGLLKPAEKIRSDGRTYPVNKINAMPTATEVPEGERLPVVGDRETLLKLLMDRGVLYDSSKRMRDMELWGAYTADGIMTFSEPIPEFSSRDVTTDAMPLELPESNGAQKMALESATAGMAAADGSVAYSQTNEQVQGVSEGDIVKTDGRYIYAMSPQSNMLRIIKADGAKLEVVSTISNENVWGAEFYLIGNDRLVVVGSENVPIEAIPYEDSVKPVKPGAIIEPEYYRWRPSNDFTVVLIYDISDRSAPEKLRRISMDGWCVSNRVIDDVVYIITNKQIWAIPYDQADSPSILPYCLDTAAGENYEPIGLDRVYYIPDTSDTSYLLVGAIDIYSDAEFKPEAYLGAGSSLYMSQNAMYVTKYRWDQPTMTGGDQWLNGKEMTDILRFTIKGTNVNYTGMGSVQGSPMNQYSMDEYEGYFRIATTDTDTGTYVTVLSVSDMQTAGRTEPLAPGERMQSMRFMGDMGYIVTFRNMDPLFTVDLSDPYKPRVLGELKIPGFSQYLHPVGDGLLLGIGRDTQEFYTRDAKGVESVIGFKDVGMKVSLFDVSNPLDPKEIDVLALGEGSAEVSNNPRALMCDYARGLYGFMAERWGPKGNWSSGALLLRVEDGKLTIAATLNPTEYFSAYGSRLCFIGNMLYIVHDNGVAVYDYSNFTKLGSIRFI